jgi:hypothetical protein
MRPAANNLLDWAVKYAQGGWRIFPCEPRGKRPLCEHGVKEATADARTVRNWWRSRPDANIALATGRNATEDWGVEVLDVDGPDAERALAELEAKYEKLPVTLTAKTGKGRHLYFMPGQTQLRNTAGKLGSHLDIRAEGGYVILPPSLHESGRPYEWITRMKPVPWPAWIAELLADREPERGGDTGATGKIREGKRNSHLASLGGAMRRPGMSQSTIEKALLEENRLRCEPPLLEAEVRRIARSVGRYEPAKRQGASNPWDAAESVDSFLEGGDEGADFFDPEKRILARACVAEIFSPRGLGKSLYALWLAIQLARSGHRVMCVDRDNPRRVIRERLKAFGATGQLPNLKIISREKCPPLTNTAAWASFPYADYDVVIVDSLDSTAEGIGEQDSAKPSRAIAPLLDIARREDGPAVLILGNTIKSGAHSRGSGVIEDRADIVYEVRDATDFHPTGSKPWVEELPPAGVDSWTSRSSRRKQREKYRLAFVATKFRIGEEPEPFILEIDTTAEPWTVSDVTDQVDQEGAAVRQRKAKEKATRLDTAAQELRAEIARRVHAKEPCMRKRQDAEPFLMVEGIKLTRKEARDLLTDRHGRDWILQSSPEDKRTIHVMPLGKNETGGHISRPTEGAQIQGLDDSNCGRPLPEHTATFDTYDTRQTSGIAKPENVAETPNFLPGRK